MTANNLLNIFQKLRQGSKNSVQNGEYLNDLELYLHIERPIEEELKRKMEVINSIGGGLLLLIGSSGDGKSHIVSSLKKNNAFSNFKFYNDATVSCSPSKSAIETLREALIDFSDNKILNTNQKLVLAINLGKVDALKEDDVFRRDFKKLIDILSLDESDKSLNNNIGQRIQTVFFPCYQIFEFNMDDNSEFIVKSDFLLKILERIAKPDSNNPFYKAYLDDLSESYNQKSPLVLNYELLMIDNIKKGIVQYVIQAIIKNKLTITPREYFDFIVSIICTPNNEKYSEKNDFYESLLPSLFFSGGDNKIQKNLYALDPIKCTNKEHNKTLSLLFSSFQIPDNFYKTHRLDLLPKKIIEITNKFYPNKGKDLIRTTRFLFQVSHLLNYHSDDSVYATYLGLLRGVLKKDIKVWRQLYNTVEGVIPRLNGSYWQKRNVIPLEIQGSRYKLFISQNILPQGIQTDFDGHKPNEFHTDFIMSWLCNGKSVELLMNYQLFDYIVKLHNGKFAVSYNNSKNISFSNFVRSIVNCCDNKREILIYTEKGEEFNLSENFGSVVFRK